MSFLPFLPFDGIIKGVSVLNIALYEFIAFSLVFGILRIILKVLSITTGIFEKILTFTIVLGIPSKILGMIVEVIKNYVIVFFVIYFLSMPNFAEFSIVNDSKFKDPILSMVAKDSLNVLNDFNTLSDKYKNTNDSNSFNLETLDLFLKYKITSVKNVKNLQKSGKININGIERVISKYEE